VRTTFVEELDEVVQTRMRAFAAWEDLRGEEVVFELSKKALDECRLYSILRGIPNLQSISPEASSSRPSRRSEDHEGIKVFWGASHDKGPSFSAVLGGNGPSSISLPPNSVPISFAS
jgi:hypothetical protein